MYACKVCYEDFENRNDVINPCKCNGTLKFVCKECLNKMLKSSNYKTCPTCRTDYKRNEKNYNYELSPSVTVEVLKIVAFFAFIILVIIKICESDAFFANIILAYIYINLIFLYFSGIFSSSISAIMFYTIIFFPEFFKFPNNIKFCLILTFYSMIFMFISYDTLTRTWMKIFNDKLKLKNLTPMMFDFDLYSYVNGLI